MTGVSSSQIADLNDRPEPGGWRRQPARATGPGGPGDGPRTVLGQGPEPMVARELRMLSYDCAPLLEAQRAGAAMNLHRLPDQREGTE